jgi:CheY-like chemotaxis protein
MAASSDADQLGACDADGLQIRALIVDDNEHFLDAARVLLEREGMAIVGVATTSAEALRLDSTQAQAEYADKIGASTAAGFIPKQRLSAPAVLRLAGGPTE